MLKRMGKKILTIFAENVCVSKPVLYLTYIYVGQDKQFLSVKLRLLSYRINLNIRCSKEQSH